MKKTTKARRLLAAAHGLAMSLVACSATTDEGTKSEGSGAGGVASGAGGAVGSAGGSGGATGGMDGDVKYIEIYYD